jgi:pyruvate oxidase
VVLNNKKLAMIEHEQRTEQFPPFGVDLLNPDFAAFAKACGGTGSKVLKPEELKGALEQAIKMNIPTILDVDTDPKRF